MRTLLAVQVTVVQGRVTNGALLPYNSHRALIDDDSDLKLASFVRFFKFGEFNRDFPTSLTTSLTTVGAVKVPELLIFVCRGTPSPAAPTHWHPSRD